MSDIIKVRKELDAISPTFCAAKWQQVTLHLHTGHTHSCHHPVTHKIPLEELKTNISALHNTNFKKLQRKEMLEGRRPKECGYCWKVEDSTENAISDRIYKSSYSWAQPYISQIKDMPWDYNVIPSYVEVSFSNVCNFKCSYCGPQISSQWMEEIERYGAYPTSTQFGNIQWLRQSDSMPIPHKEENPYVTAFWEWFPNVYDKLKHFRITGGEPLLSKDTFKVLDYITKHPNPNLELSVNTNMCPPPALLEKFIETIKVICQQHNVKRFNIFTSCDTYGKQAEYIRHGLNYDLWLSNIKRILAEVPECSFTIMSTYNFLSIPKYKLFLQDVLEIKKTFNQNNTRCPIFIDTPYLSYPAHQSIFITPEELLPLIHEQVSMMNENLESSTQPGMAYNGFFQFEVDKFKRIYDLVSQKKDLPEVTVEQKDFVKFVDEHDRRRGTNFLEVFPELENIYRTWKSNKLL